jgi:single-strand DNA-binding protein
MDLNRATIIGRLTRDPELKSLTSGNSVTSFSLATNRVWNDKDGKKQEQAEFHNIVLWGKLAEIASQYMKKGARVYVEGRLQTRDWTGDDGVKRYRTEIVGSNMIMLDGARGGSDTGASNSAPKEIVEEEIKVEDIPF